MISGCSRFLPFFSNTTHLNYHIELLVSKRRMPFEDRFLFHYCPTRTSYKTLIWENQCHQITQMHVYKLFVSTSIKFPFLCWFQRLFAPVSGPPCFLFVSRGCRVGLDAQVWTHGDWNAERHCEFLTGIYCLQQMCLVLTKDMENFPLLSVSLLLSHTCGMTDIIVWGGTQGTRIHQKPPPPRSIQSTHVSNKEKEKDATK